MSLQIKWIGGPRKGNFPTLVKGVGAGVADGKIMVAGGMTLPGGPLRIGFWFDATKRPEPHWDELPLLPSAPGWTSGAGIAGGLAIVGGRPSKKASAKCFFLDARGSYEEWKWEYLPNRPTAAMVATTFSHEEYLYTAFGTEWLPEEHAVEDTNIYRMKVIERKDNSFAGWEVLTKFPGPPRWMGGMGICGNKLYMIGGRDIPLGGLENPEPHNSYFAPRNLLAYREAWEYDMGADTWKQLEHPPRAFVSDAFTVEDRWIVLPGGRSWIVYPDGVSCRITRWYKPLGLTCYSDEVWVYDTQTGEWSLLDPLPYGTCSHRMAVWGNKVYIIGNETTDLRRTNTYGTVFEGHIQVT